MTTKVGRTSSFEVTLGKKLIFSKLAKKRFPEHKEVLEALAAAKKQSDEDKTTDEGSGSTLFVE